jgi:hypothetical protein
MKPIQSYGKKVQEYFNRINDKNSFDLAKSYNSNKVGTWLVTLGTQDEFGRGRSTGSLYKGKFIDAVERLVQDNNYFGFCSTRVENTSNGYLTLVKPEDVSFDSLEEITTKELPRSDFYKVSTINGMSNFEKTLGYAFGNENDVKNYFSIDFDSELHLESIPIFSIDSKMVEEKKQLLEEKNSLEARLKSLKKHLARGEI